MKLITHEQTFNALPLYSGSKSTLGFSLPALQATYNILQDSCARFEKPLAFHLTLNDLSAKAQSNLKYVSKVLGRWNDSLHYLMAREITPRSKVFHLHVIVIADFSNISNPIESVYDLKRKLQRALGLNPEDIQLRNRKLKDTLKIQSTVDVSTGEIIRTSKSFKSTPFHNLHDEPVDFFERASYLCKVFTKDTSYRYSFTCSKVNSGCEKASEPKPEYSNASRKPLEPFRADYAPYGYLHIPKGSESPIEPPIRSAKGYYDFLKDLGIKSNIKSGLIPECRTFSNLILTLNASNYAAIQN